MIYLHSKTINDRLVMHWSNESESATDDTPTYKIRQIESGHLYDSAVDPVSLCREYEATDIPIETPETESSAEDTEQTI